jgi:hypothetical protein
MLTQGDHSFGNSLSFDVRPKEKQSFRIMMTAEDR